VVADDVTVRPEVATLTPGGAWVETRGPENRKQEKSEQNWKRATVVRRRCSCGCDSTPLPTDSSRPRLCHCHRNFCFTLLVCLFTFILDLQAYVLTVGLAYDYLKSGLVHSYLKSTFRQQ